MKRIIGLLALQGLEEWRKQCPRSDAWDDLKPRLPVAILYLQAIACCVWLLVFACLLMVRQWAETGDTSAR